MNIYLIIGPKYGKDIKNISNLIKNKQFEKINDGYKLKNNEILNKEDIMIRYTSKFDDIVNNDDEIVIKLDTNLTDDLKKEGLAREIVRNIQDSRKQLNLQINDRIKVDIKPSLDKVLLDYITHETLGDLTNLDDCDVTFKVESYDNKVEVKIKKCDIIKTAV